MKKYPIINKYYNKNQKSLALVGLIWFSVSGIVVIMLSLSSYSEIEIGIFPRLLSIAWSLFLVWVFFKMYRNQVNLKSARIGKHLKKYYGLDGEELEATLDSIENEMSTPVYCDINKWKKHNAFFVTQNWLVGTDDIMFVRANVCKIADIVGMENIILSKRRKGITYNYDILRVKDKNNCIYDFWLRNPESAQKACEFLIDHLGL